MQFLYLPITDYRPEEIRVVERNGLFVVQLRRKCSGWITQSERTTLEEAIHDALNWYPPPQTQEYPRFTVEENCPETYYALPGARFYVNAYFKGGRRDTLADDLTETQAKKLVATLTEIADKLWLFN